MRLLEAIIDANHRALAGDERAGLRPADFADSLPVIALTCIDPRLNPLMPEVLGIPEEHFIWLRNAGNIITGPLSSTLRSVALACAIKGGREILIIGHTDCLVCRTSVLDLTNRLQALGVERSRLPENLHEFFGLFASERQNVLKAVEFVRSSPLIGPQVPVHGLLVETDSGRLEWVSNGYLASPASPLSPNPESRAPGPPPFNPLNQLLPFDLGEMKFPDTRIGELAGKAGSLLERLERSATQADGLADKTGQFARKIGELAEQAGHWLAEVQTPPADSAPASSKPPLKIKHQPTPPGRVPPTPPPVQRVPKAPPRPPKPG